MRRIEDEPGHDGGRRHVESRMRIARRDRALCGGNEIPIKCAGLQHQQIRRGVRGDAHVDSIDRRFPAPVERIGTIGERFAAMPRGKRIRSVADVGADARSGTCAGQHDLRNDSVRKVRQNRGRPGATQMHDDGMRIRRGGAIDQIVTLVRTHRIARIENCRSVNSTSALVNAAPSLQRTPRRKWYTMVRPSAERSPLARVGIRASSAGTGAPARVQIDERLECQASDLRSTDAASGCMKSGLSVVGSAARSNRTTPAGAEPPDRPTLAHPAKQGKRQHSPCAERIDGWYSQIAE